MAADAGAAPHNAKAAAQVAADKHVATVFIVLPIRMSLAAGEKQRDDDVTSTVADPRTTAQALQRPEPFRIRRHSGLVRLS